MSEMFIWGAFLGLFCRMGAARAAMKPFTQSPWQYPKYMILYGAGFYYFDWTRRLCLEDLCKNEEKIDLVRERKFLGRLLNGEEQSDAFQERIKEQVVDRTI